MVCVVLQLGRVVYDRYYSLTKDKIHRRYHVSTSLLEAAVSEYLESCAEALTKPNAGANLGVINRDADEIIRAAGKRFMYTPASAGGEIMGLHGLFHACNTISSMRYEGAEGIGKMIIARRGHPNVEEIISFSQPTYINEFRAVRKVLEISNNPYCLLTDSHSVYGIGQLKGVYDYRREDLFLVNFTKHYAWELLHGEHIMMRTIYGQPELPKSLVDQEKFQSILNRVFTGIEMKNTGLLWEVVIEATKQKHGTMVVITSSAEQEAKRLAQQAILIKSIIISPDIVRMATTIDGAVLVDDKCICYAFGVILDGIASIKGTSTRGSRYNSAIKYVEGKERTLAVVVSVDGSIDLIPDLIPQIKRSSLQSAIETLKKLADEDETNVKKFNETMKWLKEHQFYLLPEMCEEINKFRLLLEQRFPSDINIRIVYSDFAPNSEMNDSFFLNDDL